LYNKKKKGGCGASDGKKEERGGGGIPFAAGSKVLEEKEALPALFFQKEKERGEKEEDPFRLGKGGGEDFPFGVGPARRGGKKKGEKKKNPMIEIT